MRRFKEAWLPAAIYLLVAFAFDVHGGRSHQSKRQFKDGVPESASAAKDLLDKLLTPMNRPSTGKAPSIPSIASQTFYPLDPLTAQEIRAAALVIRATNRTASLQFKSIYLLEPEKAVLAPYFLSGTVPRAGSIQRRATVEAVDVKTQTPASVVVNLYTLKIESWVYAARADQVSTTITGDELDLVRSVALSDARVVKRINALGFNDLSAIITDTWEAGYVSDDPKLANVRNLDQVFFYVYLGGDDNFFAHPLDFVVYVDVAARVVAEIADLPIQEDFNTSNRTGNSVPLGSGNGQIFLPPSALRSDVRPIAISRPEGTSFQVQDRLVSWQNFQFRVGYTPFEGVVINHVTYTDNGVLRPLFYRLSISEVFLQYGDPAPPLHRKSSFDEGNFGLGNSAISLSSEFCRGSAYYYDSVIHNDRAETTVVANSTCIFEEDAGVLWAHHDSASDRIAVTRSTRLSVSSFIPVGNNDYLLSWRFHQDATISVSIRLTGTLSNNLMAVDVKAAPYGVLVGPQLYTENLQYYIGARIDADIDGLSNTVSLDDVVSAPPPNPYGNGIQIQSTVFKKPGDAVTDIIPGRSWKISNPNEVNPVNGEIPAWRLIPDGPNMPSLLTPNSPIRDRISWATHNMWVLPFNDDQVFINDWYNDGGVANWTSESYSANIENTDVVLWHVFGFTFTPNLEDWPVLSSIPDTVGFKLRPNNFFTRNPAVTVPPASQTTAYDDQVPGSGWGWKN